MKRVVAWLTMLCLTLALCVPAYAATDPRRDKFPPFPQDIKGGSYYICVYRTNASAYRLTVFDKKPNRAVAWSNGRLFSLYQDDEMLTGQVYYLYNGKSSWDYLEEDRYGLVEFDTYNPDKIPTTVFSNFDITLGKYGFFPYAPLPSSDLAALVGATPEVMDQVVSLIPLLVVFLVSLMAFWKGWTLLRTELLGV